MSYMNMRQGALRQYRRAGVDSQIAEASPHQRVQMLLDGILERLAVARGAMQRGDLGAKAALISRTFRLLEALQAGLDFETGGEIAGNLEALYDYMARCLTDANLHNSEERLCEVESLVREIKLGWDAIQQGVVATSDGAVNAQRVAQ